MKEKKIVKEKNKLEKINFRNTVSNFRLDKKLEDTNIRENNEIVNLGKSRTFTPNNLVLLDLGKNRQQILQQKTDNSTVILFQSGKDFQGLITARDKTIGGTVTTRIKAETVRKKEKKSTHIQYDKDRIDVTDKDFTVEASYYRPTKDSKRKMVKYQGGHIIDYKFSAQNSHSDEANYVPMHYFYNMTLKEYLVKRSRSDDYIEILVYTENPPRIGVKGRKKEDVYHCIPIGIIFVQICNQKIKDIYFFPNNNFDYGMLKEDLGADDKKAEIMLPHFRLKKTLHRLFTPACIIDINNNKRIAEQDSNEKEWFEVIDNILYGMRMEKCPEDKEIISMISFSVFHRQIHIENYLDLEKNSLTKQKTFREALGVFGQYLVRYALKNALKTEFISTSMRLIFLDTITSFIEMSSLVEEKVLDRINRIVGLSFKRFLKELDNIKESMVFKELLYFANLYERLCHPKNHNLGRLYESKDIFSHVKQFANVLKVLREKVSQDGEKVSQDGENDLLNLINLFIDCQDLITYAISIDASKKKYEQNLTFLKESQSIVKSWWKKYRDDNSNSQEINQTYQTGINNFVYTSTSYSDVKKRIEHLGTEIKANYANNHKKNDYESDTNCSESKTNSTIKNTSDQKSNVKNVNNKKYDKINNNTNHSANNHNFYKQKSSQGVDTSKPVSEVKNNHVSSLNPSKTLGNKI
jgi:hypothetical protein